MDPSRSHKLIYVINNCEPIQYNTNSNIFVLVLIYRLLSC